MFLEKVHEGFEVPCPACGHRFLVPAGATDESLPPPPPPPPPTGARTVPVPAPRRTGAGADDGTTALIVGIVSIVLCQVLGPVAWYMGHQIRSAARAAGVEPPGNATAGWVLGIVSTVMFFLTGCLVAVFFAIGAASEM
jgi:hypothetical protein